MERPGRWRVTLADLIVLVLAAGLAAGMARGARDVWGTRSMPSGTAQPVPVGRTAGLAMQVAAVWLAVILARGMIGLVRRPGAGEGIRGRTVPLAWRALAIALLLGLAMAESRVLRLDYLTALDRWSEPGWRDWYQVREALVPIATVLVLTGLALGLGAGRTLGGPDRRRPRPYLLLVPLTALAGLLFLCHPNGWWTLIPQLILIALEAVNNALPPGSRATTDGVSVRLLRAGIEAIPAAIVVLGLAMVAARDFERARRGEPWGTTRGGWVVRLVALAAAVAAGALMAIVAIPTIHPHWRAGFRQVLDREVIGMVLAGFGLFSAGLAARTLVPPGEGAPRGPRWPSAAVPAALIAVALVSALYYVPASSQLDPGVPAIAARLCDAMSALNVWLWGRFPDPLVASISPWLEPEPLAWTIALVFAAALILELARPGPNGAPPAPFDVIAGSRAQRARFAWLTAAVTVVCLAAMPTLLVLGQAVVHIRLHIDRWAAHGWPSPF